MTEEQKTRIASLRGEGYGYVRIARTLGLSENTVKSFCRRKNLGGRAKASMPMQASIMDGKHFCLECYIEHRFGGGRDE